MRKLTKKDKEAIELINNFISEIPHLPDEDSCLIWKRMVYTTLKKYLESDSEYLIGFNSMLFGEPVLTKSLWSDEMEKTGKYGFSNSTKVQIKFEKFLKSVIWHIETHGSFTDKSLNNNTLNMRRNITSYVLKFWVIISSNPLISAIISGILLLIMLAYIKSKYPHFPCFGTDCN